MPKRYNPIHNIARHEIAPLIRQAIRAGNIAEGVNLFLQTGEQESTGLFEKFSEAKKQYEGKRIGIEEWGRTQAQICQSILEADVMLETEMPQTPSSEIKVKILQLLQKHKTEQALECCESFGDQFLLIQAQINVAKNQCGTGLLESEYFEATKSKLNYATQALIGQIPDETPRAGLLAKLFRCLKKA